MKRVRVAAGRATYDVVIGRDVLSRSRLRPCLGEHPGGVIVSSPRVMRLHGRTLRAALEASRFDVRAEVMLPDGEAAKTSRVWERTVRAMAQARLDRSSFVIAFGGGSVGDAAGFAAATFMRGIRVIQIPTTLLSMVDSSVGGKTGINLALGKNLVGSFHQPSLVLGDLAFLETLPDRERQSGVYEILKCGLLGSQALVALIERTRGLRRATEGELEAAIAGAVRIKAGIVERDEREEEERALLNLGHTLGHALEAATSYRRFTHGEAVGHGLEFAVDLSEGLGLIGPATARRMRAVIEAVGPRPPLRASLVARASALTMGDKKRDGLTIKEILLRGPQRPAIQRLEARAYAGLAASWLASKARREAGRARA